MGDRRQCSVSSSGAVTSAGVDCAVRRPLTGSPASRSGRPAPRPSRHGRQPAGSARAVGQVFGVRCHGGLRAALAVQEVGHQRGFKLNVRRGAGASTGGILCSASGSAAGAGRGRSCRGQCSPLRFYPSGGRRRGLSGPSSPATPGASRGNRPTRPTLNEGRSSSPGDTFRRSRIVSIFACSAQRRPELKPRRHVACTTASTIGGPAQRRPELKPRRHLPAVSGEGSAQRRPELKIASRLCSPLNEGRSSSPGDTRQPCAHLSWQALRSTKAGAQAPATPSR